jgi:hypothetical protein
MEDLSPAETREEWLKCSTSCAYFIYNYVYIYDAVEADWIPFHLWPAQLEALDAILNNRLVAILKARQLGMTWLVLSVVLWKMLYRPAFTALLFSRRETEAIYLLGDQRLRGIYRRLPKWMKVRQVLTDASHEWILSNGSVAYGFPTTAGDSYTASMAFVDECDLVPDLNHLMGAVKPTIDAGGSMVLLSRSNKDTPDSTFKKIFRAARVNENDWHPIFLPWWSHPKRDKDWYEAQKRDVLGRTGVLDDLYQQYPATVEEALAPPSANRRIPFEWLLKCCDIIPALEDAGPSGVPPAMLKVYKRPEFLRDYVIGVDPAEGNPTSDDSVATIYDRTSLEQCAVLAGKIEPDVLTNYCISLAQWYNNSKFLVERNNHGHVVLQLLNDTAKVRNDVLKGLDGKTGWMSSSRGKAILYDSLVEEIRNVNVTIHDSETKTQLQSIEGSSLNAPEGKHDDYAIASALAVTGAVMKPAETFSFSYMAKESERNGRRRRNSLLRSLG